MDRVAALFAGIVGLQGESPICLYGLKMVADCEYQRIPDIWRKEEFLNYRQGWGAAQR